MKTASIKLLCGILFFTVGGAFSAADTFVTGVSPADEIVSHGQTVNGITVFKDDETDKEERESKKQALKEERERKKAEREKKKEERKARREARRKKGGSSISC